MTLSEGWSVKSKKAQSYTTLLLHLACRKQPGSCQVVNLEWNVLSRGSRVSTRCLCEYGISLLFYFGFPFSKHTPCSRQGLLPIEEGAFKVEDDFLCSFSFVFPPKISLLNPWPSQQWFPPCFFLVGRKMLWARFWNESLTFYRCHLCSCLQACSSVLCS